MRLLLINLYPSETVARYLLSTYVLKAYLDKEYKNYKDFNVNILNFEQDYNDAQVVKLEDNYRSTQPILDAAFSVIRNNIQRKDKQLRSNRGDGEPVIWCQANNEYGEAEFVVNNILSLKYREGYSNKDFAVFYIRTSFDPSYCN